MAVLAQPDGKQQARLSATDNRDVTHASLPINTTNGSDHHQHGSTSQALFVIRWAALVYPRTSLAHRLPRSIHPSNRLTALPPRASAASLSGSEGVAALASAKTASNMFTANTRDMTIGTDQPRSVAS